MTFPPESHEVFVLRRLLFEEHRCELKYGDDGEMQCAYCNIDFRHDPVERIDAALVRGRLRKQLDRKPE